MNIVSVDNRLSIIRAYANWIDELLIKGRDENIWYGNFLTLMFKHIPGRFEHRRMVMFDEVERVYSTLIRHMIRDTRSPTQRSKLPIGLFCLDLPILKSGQKSSKAIFRDLTLNDGLHIHGIMLVHIETRLRQSIKTHMYENPAYVRGDRPLHRVHVEPMNDFVTDAADYALKSLKRRMPDFDNVLVLPKTVGELSRR